ncbi:MAG: hypothetical protein LGB57_01550 [Sulfurovum sp.]|nr:hypothetical protein [Sulfurovum sp.]
MFLIKYIVRITLFLIALFLIACGGSNTVSKTIVDTSSPMSASIGIRYTIPVSMEPGAQGDIDIQFFVDNTVEEENIVVNISFDEALSPPKTFERRKQFTLKQNDTYGLHFPITIDASSNKDALYYIRLYIEVQTNRPSPDIKNFAIPIIIGNGPSDKISSERDYRDNPISGSDADETIIDR